MYLVRYIYDIPIGILKMWTLFALSTPFSNTLEQVWIDSDKSLCVKPL